MSKDSRPLSPMDLALLAPDPPGRPRFLVFRSKFDAWQCSDVGPSLESAKRLAWDQTGCGYALSVERLAVNDEPWPSKAVLPPPEYLLRAGGLVVAVPLHVGLPKPLFLIPREPAILMNVIAVPDDEPAGRALLHALDVRAFLGRVHHIVDCGWMYESGVSGRSAPCGGAQKGDIGDIICEFPQQLPIRPAHNC